MHIQISIGERLRPLMTYISQISVGYDFDANRLSQVINIFLMQKPNYSVIERFLGHLTNFLCANTFPYKDMASKASFEASLFHLKKDALNKMGPLLYSDSNRTLSCLKRLEDILPGMHPDERLDVPLTRESRSVPIGNHRKAVPVYKVDYSKGCLALFGNSKATESAKDLPIEDDMVSSVSLAVGIGS